MLNLLSLVYACEGEETFIEAFTLVFPNVGICMLVFFLFLLCFSRLDF